MAVYKLQKRGGKSRRVAVRPDSREVHVPALIICVLLAFGIWLYIVNFTADTTMAGLGESATSTTAETDAPDPEA